MWNCLGWVIAAIAVTAVLLIYDPNVPLDAKDYWILLFMEKMVKFARLKRFFLGGNVIEGGDLPHQVPPADPSVNNYKTRFDNVDVRIYDPISRCYEKGSKGPVLIYIHGGGWVKYDVDTYDRNVHRLSKLLPTFLVMSIDYRRAPAHPYPAALEDIDIAYRFLVEHAESYKIDIDRIVIAGDSAGGNLAAAFCLKLRDANRRGHKDAVLPMPKLQALIYPALQAVDFQTPSYQSVDPLLPRRAMAAFWTLYLTGSEDGHEQLAKNQHQMVSKVRIAAGRYVRHDLIPNDLVGLYSPPERDADVKLSPNLASKIDILGGDPYLSPLLAEDLSDLPNAYVIACQYDVLRDDAILYAQRLSAAGIEVETRIVMGAWHAIMFLSSFGGTKKGMQMTEEMAAFIEAKV